MGQILGELYKGRRVTPIAVKNDAPKNDEAATRLITATTATTAIAIVATATTTVAHTVAVTTPAKLSANNFIDLELRKQRSSTRSDRYEDLVDFIVADDEIVG